MQLLCPVSLGEVLDKISILRIKQQRIKDTAKLEHVNNELGALTRLIGERAEFEPFLRELTEHNMVIWDVEDALRRKERDREFDADFIELARRAYLTNDKRFEVKNRVNAKYGSEMKEQKSYESY